MLHVYCVMPSSLKPSWNAVTLPSGKRTLGRSANFFGCASRTDWSPKGRRDWRPRRYRRGISPADAPWGCWEGVPIFGLLCLSAGALGISFFRCSRNLRGMKCLMNSYSLRFLWRYWNLGPFICIHRSCVSLDALSWILSHDFYGLRESCVCTGQKRFSFQMLQEFQEHVEKCINNPPATQSWQECPVCQVGVSRATGDDDANFGDFGRMFGGHIKIWGQLASNLGSAGNWLITNNQPEKWWTM